MAQPAVESPEKVAPPPDPRAPYETAKKWLEQSAHIWDWVEDVECVGLGWVSFR